MSRPPFLLGPEPEAPFPPPRLALSDPDGLLAVGGDLSPQRLERAYRAGIFPWYSRGQPILWWSPDPRTVFDSARFALPRRFRRQLRASPWQVRADQDFAGVVQACAHTPRPGQRDTWIVPEMARAYQELHALGHGHSIEVYEDGELVGGIYGLAFGHMVYGESMFSRRSGASKLALAALLALMRERGWPLLDAQIENPHLRLLGAQRLSRTAFLAQVADLTARPGRVGSWSGEFGERQARDYA